MKCKAKLKLQFLNQFKLIMGETEMDIQVEYPAPPVQKVLLKIQSDVRPCVLSGLRVLRSDSMELFYMDLPSTFVGKNQEIVMGVQLTLRPIHVALLSEVPC